jgi:hypothetical protein
LGSPKYLISCLPGILSSASALLAAFRRAAKPALHKEMISNGINISEQESVLPLTISIVSHSFNLVEELEHPMSRCPDLGILTSNQSRRRFGGSSQS